MISSDHKQDNRALREVMNRYFRYENGEDDNANRNEVLKEKGSFGMALFPFKKVKDAIYTPNEDAGIIFKNWYDKEKSANNKHAIIEIIAQRSVQELKKWKEYYNWTCGNDTKEDLFSKLKGLFNSKAYTFMTDLFYTEIELDCKRLYDELNAIWTIDYTVIARVICPKENESIKELKHTYGWLYGVDLVELASKKLKSPFKSIIAKILTTERNMNKVPNIELCKKHVTIWKSWKSFSWEDPVFTHIFVKNSKANLEQIERILKDEDGLDLTSFVFDKFKGDELYLMKSLFLGITNPEKYNAIEWLEAMEGPGTDYPRFCHALSYTFKKGKLKKVSEIFQVKYQVDLKDRMKEESVLAKEDVKMLMFELIDNSLNPNQNEKLPLFHQAITMK